MDFETFKAKYVHRRVNEHPNHVDDQQKVSVCIMTYNHVGYIKDCLDGVLRQQTNFSFEILLGEDDSKDGTREICLEYANKYPGKIRLFLHHRENNIAINGNPTGLFNSLYNLYNARGKYMALCEGDDYWTDPQKLQRQLEFMEENEDCSLCYHAAKVTYEDKSRPDQIFKPFNVNTLKKFTLTEFIASIDGLGITTASVLFHLDLFKDIPDWLFKTPYGDACLKLIAGYRGLLGYIGGEPMSLHRRVTPGSWSSNIHSKEWYIQRIKNRIAHYNLFSEYSNHEFDRQINRANRRKIASILFRMSIYCPKKELIQLLIKYSDAIPYLRPKEIAALSSRLLLGKKQYNYLFNFAKGQKSDD